MWPLALIHVLLLKWTKTSDKTVSEIHKTRERTVTETHQQFSLSIVHVELKQEAFTVGPVDLSHRLHLKPPAAAAIEEVPFPKDTFNHWYFRYFRFMNLTGLT